MRPKIGEKLGNIHIIAVLIALQGSSKFERRVLFAENRVFFLVLVEKTAFSPRTFHMKLSFTGFESTTYLSSLFSTYVARFLTRKVAFLVLDLKSSANFFQVELLGDFGTAEMHPEVLVERGGVVYEQFLGIVEIVEEAFFVQFGVF